MHHLASRLAVLAVIAFLPLLGARAQTALPPDLLASIRQQVQASRAMAAREAALANGLGNPQLAQTMARKAQRRADTALTSAVVSIIAANRNLAGAVVDAAVAEAPESRNAIVAGVTASFPTLRDRLGPTTPVGFTPAPPAPRPIGRPPPSPAPAPTPGLPEEVVDPLEPVNRVIFAVNDVLDTLVFRPVAVIYGYVTPDLVKESVNNFFANLNAPVILANDLLQGTFDDAGVTTARFLINSTVGLAGFFEVAEDFGFPAHYADFGQTLHSYGVGQGLYVMIPLLGPSTARDAVGSLVDTFFQPANYILETPLDLGFALVEGVAERETLIVALDDLRENSIDFYAALRGAYYQDRATELRKGRSEGASEQIDALFEDLE
jgi:phospholipid-binding lipoprotein MlaA